MKICFFSEYPPLTGRLANQTYWLARALGRKGMEVHIITDALERGFLQGEEIDFEKPLNLLNYQPPNVFVHSLDDKQRNLSQNRRSIIERLLSLGIKILEKYNCDLIDAYCSFPYSPVALIAKFAINRPLLLRWEEDNSDKLSADFNQRFPTQLVCLTDGLIMPKALLTRFGKELKGEKNLLYCLPSVEIDRDFFKNDPFKILLNFNENNFDNFGNWADAYLKIYCKAIKEFKSFNGIYRDISRILKNRHFLFNKFVKF